MNETLQTLGGIIAVGFVILCWLRFQRRLKRITSLPTDALKAMFDDPQKEIFFAIAAASLRERGEDLSFALPAILDMTLSGKMSCVTIGKALLRTHFPDLVQDIDLSRSFVSQESKAKLQQLRQDWQACREP